MSQVLVLRDGEIVLRIDQVDGMVSDPPLLIGSRFSGADVESPVDLARIRRHDLGWNLTNRAQVLGEFEGEGTLAHPGRTNDDDEWGSPPGTQVQSVARLTSLGESQVRLTALSRIRQD